MNPFSIRSLRAMPVLLAGIAALAFAPTAFAGSDEDHGGSFSTPGAVFTETNTAPNSVLAYTRGADGRLTPAGQYATGGNGQPAGNPPLGIAALDAAGPVELAADGDNRSCLFAVNAGNNTVSSFRVWHDGVALADVESSGGFRPVSVTSAHRGPDKLVMYVLNSGDGKLLPASIQGFYVSDSCRLIAIPDSNHFTSSPNSLPAAIRFDRHGRVLAVSERFAAGNGDIDIFPVNSRGVAGSPVFTPSPEPTPYGLDWNHRGDILSVTNENIPTVGAGSTVTTYRLNPDDTLTLLDDKPSPGAACWNLFTNNDKFLYVSNPLANGFAQGNEAAFRVERDGTMTHIANYPTMYNAIDNALSHNSRFLYVLSGQVLLAAGSSAIDGYRINPDDGTLTPIGTVTIPGNSTSGLAAW